MHLIILLHFLNAFNLFLLIILVCGWVCAHVLSVSMHSRRTTCIVGFLFPSRGFQGLNLGNRALWQVSLLTEPSGSTDAF